MSTPLPESIEAVVASPSTPENKLQEALKTVGHYLEADRCFMYVRDPSVGKGRIAFCWRKDASIPNPVHGWQEDTKDLPKEDPLFRAALAGRPSVFVGDVETAPADVLSQEFERITFGHRALIHAHITDEQSQLWGILQPCVFGRPRHWTEEEREAILAVLPLLLPVIQMYVRNQGLQ